MTPICPPRGLLGLPFPVVKLDKGSPNSSCCRRSPVPEWLGRDRMIADCIHGMRNDLTPHRVPVLEPGIPFRGGGNAGESKTNRLTVSHFSTASVPIEARYVPVADRSVAA